MTEQLTLALPYIQIDKLAIRQTIRDRKEIIRGSRESSKIPFDAIEIRENFNTRYSYEAIVELAENILQIGLIDPIYVDVLENGKIYVERGHRRFKAIQYLRENNKIRMIGNSKIDDFSVIECFINKSDMTELDRILNLFGTNMHSKELKPLEQAETAWRLKHCLGSEMSNEVIAKKLAISRQSVDNLITIAKASTEIKNEIKNGDLSITKALEQIRAKTKLEKQAEEKHEETLQSAMYIQPGHKDELAGEMKELKELDKQAEDNKADLVNGLEEIKAAKELERLQEVADEIIVSEETMKEAYGKRFAAAVKKVTVADFVDDETGEIVPVETTAHLFKQGDLIDAEIAKEIIKEGIEVIYVFKAGYNPNPIAQSVITEPPATDKKGKYDEDRPEIAQVQNAIKLGDRISVRVEKLEIPDGDKKDLTDWVKWMQKDLLELREWVHSNKKQNKKDR